MRRSLKTDICSVTDAHTLEYKYMCIYMYIYVIYGEIWMYVCADVHKTTRGLYV